MVGFNTIAPKTHRSFVYKTGSRPFQISLNTNWIVINNVIDTQQWTKQMAIVVFSTIESVSCITFQTDILECADDISPEMQQTPLTSQQTTHWHTADCTGPPREWRRKSINQVITWSVEVFPSPPSRVGATGKLLI